MINLEGHNLSVLDRRLIPDAIDVVTVDLSYLALDAALPQLEHLHFHAHADLLALVKPTFELRAAKLAASDRDLRTAVRRAERAVKRSGWTTVAQCAAPATGRRGAQEVFLHAKRR